MKNLKILFLVIVVMACGESEDKLLKDINLITKDKKAKVAVSVLDLKTGKQISLNGDLSSPIQSVFKFHLALKVLNEVDLGSLPLNQKIRINKVDYIENTYSPMADKYPKAGMEMSVSDLLKYSVEFSDNNACDVLFRLTGGPVALNKYLTKNKVRNTIISQNEQQMHENWDNQFKNTSTTNATVKLLDDFVKGKLLSKSNTLLLTKFMVDSPTGANRLKGLLKKNVVVAHKTGTSGTNSVNLTPAVNDMGIIRTPNGHKYAIAVFVSNSYETMEVNEKIIAEISKLVFDHYEGGIEK